MFGPGDAAERRFVREALLGLGAERPGLLEAARAVRDWDRVLAIAAAGSVAESIWSGVTLRGAEAGIPEPARTVLREAHEGATARNALLLSEAASVQAAFAEAGVPSVILKGPGLLVAHCPDIGARHVGDVDVLVRDGDVARAEEVARGMPGARAPTGMFYDGRDREIGIRQGGHATKFHTRSGIALEIHARIPGGSRDGSEVEGVFARSRAIPWQGRSLRIPSRGDVGAIACLHVFDAHHGAGRFLWRHLGDLAVVIGNGGATWEEIEQHWPGGVDRTALRLSRHLLEVGPPGPVEAAWRAIAGRRGAVMAYLELGDPASRSRLRMLFPARAFMASRYDVPEDSPLLPLLYLWRPLRGVWGMLTGR